MTDYTVITSLPFISQGTQYIQKSITITETDENTKSTVTTETLTGKIANSKVNVSIGSVETITIPREIFITFFCSNQEKFDSNKQPNIYKFSPISYTKAKLIADGKDYYLDTKNANDPHCTKCKWNNSLRKINFSEMEIDNNKLNWEAGNNQFAPIFSVAFNVELTTIDAALVTLTPTLEPYKQAGVEYLISPGPGGEVSGGGTDPVSVGEVIQQKFLLGGFMNIVTKNNIREIYYYHRSTTPDQISDPDGNAHVAVFTIWNDSTGRKGWKGKANPTTTFPIGTQPALGKWTFESDANGFNYFADNGQSFMRKLNLVKLIKDYYEKPFSDSPNNFDSNVNNYVGGIGKNSTQNNKIIWCPFQSIKFFKKLYAISKKNLLHLKTYVSNPIDLSDLSDLSDDNNTVLINIQVVFKSNSTNTGIKEGETETTTANIANLVLTVPISITK